jgi:capsid assembly protease
MNGNYERILRAVATELWCIQEAKFRQIEALLMLRAAGGRVADEQVQEIVAAARQPTVSGRAGTVAVIPIYGMLSHRMNLLADTSGGTSMQAVTKSFRQTVADPEIAGIVLDFDTPGGSVRGVQELADEIFAARGRKPIIAHAMQAASSGFWLATQADELIVSPSGDVGSIGVFAVLANLSKMYEAEGVQHEIVRYGDNKAEINDFEPISDEARAHLKGQITEVGETFVKAVARGRGVTPAHVKAEFGQGRSFLAKQSAKLGMADRIGTLDDAIARAAGGGRRRSGMQAEAAVALVAVEPADDTVDEAPRLTLVAEESPAPAPPAGPDADLEWAKAVRDRVSREIDRHAHL